MKRMIQFPGYAASARELQPLTPSDRQRLAIDMNLKRLNDLKLKRKCHQKLRYLCHTFLSPNKLIAARSFADRLSAFFARRWPGSQVDVFGSCASGLAGPDSDVDLVAHGHADLVRGDATAIVKVHQVLEDCELGLFEFRRVLRPGRSSTQTRLVEVENGRSRGPSSRCSWTRSARRRVPRGRRRRSSPSRMTRASVASTSTRRACAQRHRVRSQRRWRRATRGGRRRRGARRLDRRGPRARHRRAAQRSGVTAERTEEWTRHGLSWAGRS